MPKPEEPRDDPPTSRPLPVRDGLGPARLRLHGGPVAAELRARFGAAAAAKVAAGEVVTADGVVVDETTVLPAGSHVFLYRDLPIEVPVPFEIPVLHRDDDLVVVDKPHFLSTMPRGRHVAQTALVRLRRELELPELSPAHRLDRLTAGVLLFTTRRELRGPIRRCSPAGPCASSTWRARQRRPPASFRGWCATGSSNGAAACRPARSPANPTPKRWSKRWETAATD